MVIEGFGSCRFINGSFTIPFNFYLLKLLEIIDLVDKCQLVLTCLESQVCKSFGEFDLLKQLWNVDFVYFVCNGLQKDGKSVEGQQITKFVHFYKTIFGLWDLLIYRFMPYCSQNFLIFSLQYGLQAVEPSKFILHIAECLSAKFAIYQCTLVICNFRIIIIFDKCGLGSSKFIWPAIFIDCLQLFLA